MRCPFILSVFALGLSLDWALATNFGLTNKACPEYATFSQFAHYPLSGGPLRLPSQRPSTFCRTFISPLVETIIEDITSRMVNKDLAKLFENAFPNTLDTTVKFHVDGTETTHTELKARRGNIKDGTWEGAQTFVVTGDINAEWLRDSTNQLLQYQPLATKSPEIFNLILGKIATQADQNGQDDYVHPAYEPSFVFECKYELDSLAHFLAIANTFHEETGSLHFLTPRWYTALDTVLRVIDEQSRSTFEPETGKFQDNVYRFSRMTSQGSETLSLNGLGNPLSNDTGLIRSAFRPSDDATIFGFLIPSNAMMSVELKRTASILRLAKKAVLGQSLDKRSQKIVDGIYEHAVVDHKKYGKVFAFEVDGFGSHLLMDDANIPSLLALPILGFVDRDDEIYQNTRRMILDKTGNPYFLQGKSFKGIGGPHVGVNHAWPMALLVQAQTSDSDKEIMECLELVLKSSRLGLVHESINVERIGDYTRSWFAWANSVFAQTILDLAERKPHLLFGKGAEPYLIR